MDLLTIIVVLLVVSWALGFGVFHVGWLIHALLVVAVVVLIVRLLRGNSVIALLLIPLALGTQACGGTAARDEGFALTNADAGTDCRVWSEQLHYFSTEPVYIHFDGLPGNDHDAVALAYYASPSTAIVDHLHYRWTHKDTEGLLGFYGCDNSPTCATRLAQGRYVARVFFNEDWTRRRCESQSFYVWDIPAPYQNN